MDMSKLYEEILKMKNETLMEEPCPLYEPEWEDFWYNEDRTTTDDNEGRSSGDD